MEKNHCLDKCPVHHASVFRGIDPSTLEYLTAHSETQNHEPRRNLFLRGNRVSGIYCIKSGRVKIYRTMASGKKQIVALYGPGSILGLGALLSADSWQATAETLVPTTVCHINRPALLESMQKDHTLTCNMLKEMGNIIIRLSTRLEQSTHWPVRKRVAALLVKYSKEAGEDGFFTLPFSKTEFAQICDTSKETISRVFKEFLQKKLIIARGRQIRILEPGNLHDLR
jgi:CRP-like cAMP-binding protein